MKTNKINVVMSLNKTVVSRFDDYKDDIIRASTAACAGQGAAGVTRYISVKDELCKICQPATSGCLFTSPNTTTCDKTTFI